MADFDPTVDALPLDWRGEEIGLFTRVLYCRDGRWKVGKVVDVARKTTVYRTWEGPKERHHWEFKVEWAERSSSYNSNKIGRGILIDQLTVFREGDN